PISPRVEAYTRRAQLLAEDGTAQFNDNEVFVKGVEEGVCLYFDAKTKKELGKLRAWQTSDYSLQVMFSPDGKVMGKQIYHHENADENGWNALRRFLKL